MSDSTETAILAGGCAWIMEQLLRDPDGVISTRLPPFRGKAWKSANRETAA